MNEEKTITTEGVPKPPKPVPKFVQIAAAGGDTMPMLYALDEAGQVWRFWPGIGEWGRVPLTRV